MKKIIFLLITFILLPISVMAANYDIKDYYIDANILDNGDMNVKELFVLKGNFNGYERDILYSSISKSIYDGSDLTNITIKGGTYTGDVSFDTFNEEFKEFSEVTSASNGDSLKYIKSNLYYGYRYRMYYKTSNSSTAFLISYTIKDVVILHNDCAEVTWKFIGDDFEDEIRNLHVRVSAPGVDNSNTFRWWFHGDLAGNSEKYVTDKTTGAVATLDKNAPYSFVETRILFNKDLVNASLVKKIDNNDVLESITSYEDNLAIESNKKRESIKILYYGTVIITWTYIAGLIAVWIFVYLKYDKERKAKFLNDYNREFIDDYNVEVIDYLMNKNITPNAMSASIMNLIYKKNIKFEEYETKKNKKEYKFTLDNKDNLNHTENILVDFLFDRVGSDNTFTTEELTKYAKGTKTCETFMNSYTKWKRSVIKDGEAQNFFEKNNKKFIFGGIAILVAILIVIIVRALKIEYLPVYATVILAFIFMIYLGASNKKSEKGIEHFAKWKAFKKFLNDFGAFDIKELPEIELWERYLVYATIFGLADKVQKAMNVKIKEFNIDEMHGGYYYYHPYINLAPAINSSVRSAYSGAQTAINAAHASSSMSSMGGSGGGFSSGGGFGGGGGGGRGF